MPFEVLTAPPAFLTPEQHAAQQTSTPASFASLPPLLRFLAFDVRIKVEPSLPGFNDSSVSNGGTNGDAPPASVYQAQGALWITEQALSFLPRADADSLCKGFTIDYPSISLHAVTRSVPESLQSMASAGAPSACLYCQLDDNPESGEDEQYGSEEEEDNDSRTKEMWIVVPSNGGEGAPTLDELFDALSICSSLHSSSGGANSDGHPLASIGPFGTGLRTDAPPGAFEDAEDVDEAEIAVNGAQPEEAGLSETGRRALAHLEAVLDWPGEEDATTTSNPTDIESGAAGRGKEAHAQASAVSDLQTATQEPSRVTPSNTLIFASLPPEFFDTPELARALLDLLHAYGKLLSYLPLPLFGRAVVAYEELEAAKRAKEKLDLLLLPFEDESEETVLADEARYSKSADYASGASGKHSYDTLRVYYGPSSSEIFSGRESASKALGVPITDRNFLISPPGSPPVGWEPIVEDPPNQDTLADDLIRALGQLRDSGANLEDHRPKPLSGDGGEDDQKGRTTPTEDSEEQQAALAAPRLASAQPAVIIPAMGAMPGVSVEAFDGAEDGDRQTAITSGGKKYMGVSISSVKATVESMRSNRSRSGSNASLLSVEDAQTGLGGGGASSFGKITPTARPPLAP